MGRLFFVWKPLDIYSEMKYTSIMAKQQVDNERDSGYIVAPVDLQCHNWFSEGHPRRDHTPHNVGGGLNLVDFGDGQKVPACWICGKRLVLTDIVSEVRIVSVQPSMSVNPQRNTKPPVGKLSVWDRIWGFLNAL